MRKLTTFFFIQLFFISVNSQELDWAIDLQTDVIFSSNVTKDNFQSDKDGNVIRIGNFLDSADFDPDTSVSQMLYSSSCPDVYVARYTNMGALSWVRKIDITSIIGYNTLSISHVRFDGGGNVYLGGIFRGNLILNDPSTADTLYGPRGHDDVFIAKYSKTGSYLWSKRIAGELDPSILTGFDVSTNGDIFIAGTFAERLYFNYPSKAKSTSLYADIKYQFENFIARLDLNGVFQWAHMLTGPGIIGYPDLSVDNQKNIILSGTLNDSVFFDTISNLISVPKSGRDLLLVKINGSGNFLQKHLIWTPASRAFFMDVDLNNDGDLIILGSIIRDTLHFDSTHALGSSLNSEYFIARFNNNLKFELAFTLNNSVSLINAFGLDVSADGSTSLLGWFRGKPDFDPTQDTFFVQCQSPNSEPFIAIYDTGFSTLNVLNFERISSGNYPYFSSIQSDDDNNIYVSGHAGDSCDLDPSDDTLIIGGIWYPRATSGCIWNTNTYGSPSVIVARYKYCRPPSVLLGPGPDKSCQGSDASLYITVDGNTPMQYQWYKDNKAIPGANGAYYQMYNVQYADSGIYFCLITNDCGDILSDVLEFKVINCTGLDEYEDKPELRVYPNPSGGQISIDIPNLNLQSNAKINIMSIRGQLVYEQSVSENQFSFVLEESVKDGFYILELRNGQERFRSRLIIDRK